MRTPKRMNHPRRMNAPQRPSMFPHTVTLYNIVLEPDKADVTQDKVINYITLLKGVLVDDSKAVNVRDSGLESADAVNLFIPFDVEAIDALTNKPKKYLTPTKFWRSENKSEYWTLAISAKGAPLNGYTFFVKGVALPPKTTSTGKPIRPDMVREVVEAMYDHVYNITKLDTKDFGSLKHWEAGAN